METASTRQALAAPLSFPSADGPGRPRGASALAEPLPLAAAAGAWPIAPALMGALCAVAVVSIALHDGLGLRAAEQALLADRQERATRALQAVDTALRLDADSTREIVAAQPRTAGGAPRNAGQRESAVEQSLRDLAINTDLDIRVADAGGVLFSSTAAADGCFAADRIAPLLERPPSAWQAQTVDGETGCVVRTVSIAGRRMVLLARAVDSTAAAGMAAVRRQLRWIGVLTLAVAALAGLLLARRLNRPLRTLSTRAEQLAVRYTGRAVVHSRNEMQNLLASVEAMIGALQAQFDRLRGLHLDELQTSLELQRRYALMRLLRDLSTAALECESLEQVFERALDELGGYLDWPIGRLLLPGQAAAPGEAFERSVWFVTERERFAHFISASEVLPSDRAADGLIGRADATAMPHWVTDLGRLDGWARRDAALQSGLKSGFVIPLMAGGSILAFIEFFSNHRIEASAEMIELIEAIHTELWQAGERHHNRPPRGAPAARSAALDLRRQLDVLGAASR